MPTKEGWICEHPTNGKLVEVVTADYCRQLEERERRCPTMLGSEARALLRALQEIAEEVGLSGDNSPRETVAAVRKMAVSSNR